MSGKRSSKQKHAVSPLDQILSSDYWEGFYAVNDRVAVHCFDIDGESAGFKVFDLTNGRSLGEGSLKYSESTRFTEISDKVRDIAGRPISVRISNAVETPDRDDEILGILENPEVFELLRIRNLIKHLFSRGINAFGGPIGGQEMSECGYEGFYILEDGMLLECRDCSEWEDKVNLIVDGATLYHIIDPAKPSAGVSNDLYHGFLRGEYFSDIMEELMPAHGRIVSRLSESGDENDDLLAKAIRGDGRSIELVNHRFKLGIKKE